MQNDSSLYLHDYFAENPKQTFKMEVQSLYYIKSTISLHNTVARHGDAKRYYHNVSDDKTHDAFQVDGILKDILKNHQDVSDFNE